MIFAPASITCIFSPHVGEDARSSGSIGVGFTIERGLYASPSTKTTINGESWSFSTLNDVLKKVGLEGVEINASLPFGCGFGMSGAAALATAAVAASSGSLSYIEAADIAHIAEVENFTGLGDVVTQAFGGVVVRKNAACPSRANLERFYWDVTFDFVVMGEISTKEIIGDDLKRKTIGEAGKRWTKEFLSRPTLENLFHCSNGFAREAGLLELVGDVVEAVESYGGRAGMVMLGKTVFAVNGYEALKEFGEPFRAKLDCCGVRRVML